MSRRPASFTQADVARIIRAARKAGAAVARVVMPNGTEFKIDLSPQSTGEPAPERLEPKPEVVL